MSNRASESNTIEGTFMTHDIAELRSLTLNDLPDIIKQTELGVEALEAKEAELEGAWIEARRQRLQMRSTLNSYRNYATFIFRLPNELLVLVFERCVDTYTGHTLSKHAIPWVLAQTCRRWRHVVLRTPSLWNPIRIDTRRLPQSPIQMMKSWLERSQTVLLSCTALIDAPPSEADVEEQIFQQVLAHSHRWGHLAIELRARCDLYYRFASAKHLFFSNLRSLHIFVEAPPSYTIAPPVLNLSAPSLSNLEISFVTSKKFLEIINALTVLENCHLSISSGFILDVQMVAFSPSLRYLEVLGPLSNMINLLYYISTPSLLRLFLSPPDCSTIPSVAAHRLLQSVVSFQTRSQCRLRRLRVPITFFTSNTSPRNFDCLSSVQELHVCLEAHNSHQCFIQNLRNIDVLPHLKEMHVLVLYDRVEETFRFFLSQFLDMVELRRRSAKSRSSRQSSVMLESIEIDMIRKYGRPKVSISINYTISARLARLQREGLTLLGGVRDGKLHPFHSSLNYWDIEKHEKRWSQGLGGVISW
ncbi:hypothetical protein E1B28_003525 [Marasmius oreades]|uniref:F-box domain-containing protein n=1 Tax=Marasmius oreades TaxID=181124 RepID=A0A9P7RME0_9AGAR|nr:uncharacterized protein E1B28_003525 [Marasmius oreades]KAG7086002.1 hypothetical protein E1B28_003525 [Marasmius oreades]